MFSPFILLDYFVVAVNLKIIYHGNKLIFVIGCQSDWLASIVSRQLLISVIIGLIG